MAATATKLLTRTVLDLYHPSQLDEDTYYSLTVKTHITYWASADHGYLAVSILFLPAPRHRISSSISSTHFYQ